MLDKQKVWRASVGTESRTELFATTKASASHYTWKLFEEVYSNKKKKKCSYFFKQLSKKHFSWSSRKRDSMIKILHANFHVGSLWGSIVDLVVNIPTISPNTIGTRKIFHFELRSQCSLCVALSWLKQFDGIGVAVLSPHGFTLSRQIAIPWVEKCYYCEKPEIPT